MSLESEIQKLTAAVQELTKTILAGKPESIEMPTLEEVNEVAPPNPEKEPEAAKQAEKQKADKSADSDTKKIDNAALQSWCLEQVRANKGFKQKLIDVLGAYGVKTIAKLPEGKAPDVYRELGGE